MSSPLGEALTILLPGYGLHTVKCPAARCGRLVTITAAPSGFRLPSGLFFYSTAKCSHCKTQYMVQAGGDAHPALIPM